MTLPFSAVDPEQSPAPEQSPEQRRRRGGLLARAMAAGVASTLLGGCLPDLKSDITGSIGSLFPFRRAAAQPEPSEADWRELANLAGKRYEANPDDRIAALAYGRSLREIGQHQQAVAVLRQAALRAPQDKALLAAYGRSLIDVGNLREASDVLARAHTQDKPDWRVLSAQGTIADQMGNHVEARRYYEAALRLSPDEPSLLSNLGLSYALSRNLPEAETVLRQAAANPKADRRVRQNLALVLGLSGKADEAETLLKRDLPPAQAAAGVAYFRRIGAASPPAKVASRVMGAPAAVRPAERRAPTGRADDGRDARTEPSAAPSPEPAKAVAPVVAGTARPRARDMLPAPATGEAPVPLLPPADASKVDASLGIILRRGVD